MKKNIYEAKTKEEAINKASIELNTDKENLIIKVLEEKQGLLKKIVKIEVFTVNELTNYLKDCINTILKLMNIEANLELRIREKNIEIKIFSNNNSILIGKDGKNLESLQNIVRQILMNNAEKEYRINLDVENYKEKRVNNLERTAKKIAREVKITKVEAKLDPMNSYERKLVHEAIQGFKYISSESEGEEPNRRVVIKYVEAKEEE